MGGENSRPVEGIEDYASRGKGFYFMCRQHNGASIFVYGLPQYDPILKTIENAIDRIMPGGKVKCNVEKHGNYATKFELSEWFLFTSGQSFKDAAKGKIMFNEIIKDLINFHGYRPAFSTDLSRYNDRCTIYFEKIMYVTQCNK